MKKLAILVGLAGLGAAVFLGSHSRAADRVDASPHATTPLGDIEDVYAWMTGNNVNLVMTVSPGDDGTHAFSPAVLYVFHVASKTGLGVGMPPQSGTETKVVCKLTDATHGECWVIGTAGVKDYVTGDPSLTEGTVSDSGKLKLFAGRRSDPAFFDLAGLTAATASFAAQSGGITFDAAGCPNNLTTGQALGLRNLLKTPGTGGMCPQGATDCFANANVMAIVLQVDKGLVNVGSNTTLAVWGSTHVGS